MVGCPVLCREWVLPDFFDAVDETCARAGVTPEYVFVGDPAHDRYTWAVINQHQPVTAVAVVDHRGHDCREWNMERHTRLAWLRNRLLGAVRDRGPDLFLSLDSDVLAHPDLVANLIETVDTGFDAAGGKCFLGEGAGRLYPSYAMLDGGWLSRSDTTAVFRADVLMACVLMTPRAYHVDYVGDPRGEDIGWALNAAAAGVTLGFDGRVTSTHVHNPAELGAYQVHAGRA